MTGTGTTPHVRGDAPADIDFRAGLAVATGLVHDNGQYRAIAQQLMPCTARQQVLLDGVHSNPAPAMTADAGGAQVMRVAAAEIHRFSPFVSRGRRRAQISVKPHV